MWPLFLAIHFVLVSPSISLSGNSLSWRHLRSNSAFIGSQ
jgi:hypothetical protein